MPHEETTCKIVPTLLKESERVLRGDRDRPSARQPVSPIQYTICFLFVNADPARAARLRSIRAVDLAAKPLPLRSQPPAVQRDAGGGGAEPNRRASAGSPSGRFTSLSPSPSPLLWLLQSVWWLDSKSADDRERVSSLETYRVRCSYERY